MQNGIHMQKYIVMMALILGNITCAMDVDFFDELNKTVRRTYENNHQKNELTRLVEEKRLTMTEETFIALHENAQMQNKEFRIARTLRYCTKLKSKL